MNISISSTPELLGEGSGLAQIPHGLARGAAFVGATFGGGAAGGGAFGVGTARIAFAAVLNDVPKLLPTDDKPVIRATAKSDAIMP